MDTLTIQAIETLYAGYRFRSRLEARWAVFFDRLNVPYEYEPQGFAVDDVQYLPDFLIHDTGCPCDGKKRFYFECKSPELFRLFEPSRTWLKTYLTNLRNGCPSRDNAPLQKALALHFPEPDCEAKVRKLAILSGVPAAIAFGDPVSVGENFYRGLIFETDGRCLPLWPIWWSDVRINEADAAAQHARKARFEHGEKP